MAEPERGYVAVRGLWHRETADGRATLCGWMTVKADARAAIPPGSVCQSCERLAEDAAASKGVG